MGCPPGWPFHMQGQGSLLGPSLGEMALEGESSHQPGRISTT